MIITNTSGTECKALISVDLIGVFPKLSRTIPEFRESSKLPKHELGSDERFSLLPASSRHCGVISVSCVRGCGFTFYKKLSVNSLNSVKVI